ncbi:MAG: glycoside hydrolase family 95-like protein [Saprospiraceae bacterium]
MKIRFALFCNMITFLFVTQKKVWSQPFRYHHLTFYGIPDKWDEGLPLGNGTLGVLIWQKDKKLRMALDNVFLWDDRPMPEIEKLKFDWVVEQVKKYDYTPVQKLGDEPYEANPAPTKIPAAAIEFETKSFGKVARSQVDIKSAVANVRWENGVTMESYIHGSKNYGFFEFQNLPGELLFEIVPPKYQNVIKSTSENSVSGSGLEKLGYPSGTIIKTEKSYTYFQQCHGKSWYKVIINYTSSGKSLRGQWTILWSGNGSGSTLTKMPKSDKKGHAAWWKSFWSKSSLSVPDSILEKQYYLEMYKFGCTSRAHTPPISLQAVWTADNGRLPPWKGDFHHDLNTQLSYWPGYIGNHLDLTSGFTNWLWNIRDVNRKWTKSYFGTDGLNVPGVTTISGKEMGGWIQYSMSPTTVAWLAQHFYWQYQYGQDKTFLINRCVPYFKEAETYFSSILKSDKNGHLTLPLSSSPEIHDNSIKAWYQTFTNYDLALVKWFYAACKDLYQITNDSDFSRIEKILTTLPELSTNETGLIVAPGENLEESHRHLSNYMAIFPLEIINFNDNKEIIENSIRHIEKLGTKAWVGYSFSWMASLYAKVKDGDKSAEMLRRFATNFTSPNSFHLNGDQKGGQYSSHTYRPFTLEGNFAYARGLQEMLLQSHDGYIDLFPAVPDYWKNVEFDQFRTKEGVLISAQKSDGKVKNVNIKADVDIDIKMKLNLASYDFSGIAKKDISGDTDLVTITMKKGDVVNLVRK